MVHYQRKYKGSAVLSCFSAALPHRVAGDVMEWVSMAHTRRLVGQSVAARPYILLSCAVSLDGYLDDAGPRRLLLSNAVDLDRVDALRAQCDAILVGANTLRRDNPHLQLRDPARRQARAVRGLPATPLRVTATRSGDLSPHANFFAAAGAAALVYAAHAAADGLRGALGAGAIVVDLGAEPAMTAVAADLHARGVQRLLVEGGGRVFTQFLQQGMADELQIAVAPVFVGDTRAPRFVRAGAFPWCPGRRARLLDVAALGDVAVLRYALSDRCAG